MKSLAKYIEWKCLFFKSSINLHLMGWIHIITFLNFWTKFTNPLPNFKKYIPHCEKSFQVSHITLYTIMHMAMKCQWTITNNQSCEQYMKWELTKLKSIKFTLIRIYIFKYVYTFYGIELIIRTWCHEIMIVRTVYLTKDP